MIAHDYVKDCTLAAVPTQGAFGGSNAVGNYGMTLGCGVVLWLHWLCLEGSCGLMYLQHPYISAVFVVTYVLYL